ncbi:hypothetical protein HHK36_015427 [Tetracentron sinense]|uniref:S phase cyclin A-associated protein in the endoplasmic reticulum N-terminal domain-containing protein n=1 Tax=Tetracentron sinense TaxID=13715 RepID=A0A834Z318_TETSI|nr:hypothetical protein HHK36_015427 [Tetracentron sinense]
MCRFDKLYVNQPKSPAIKTISIAESTGGIGDVQEVSPKEKLDMASQIKWGDLEGDALVLHCENRVRSEIKFGDIGDASLAVCRKPGNANDSVACVPSCISPQVVKVVVTSVDTGHVPDGMLLLAPSIVSFEGNCTELNEISSEGVKIPIVDEKIVGPSDDVSNLEEIHHEDVKPTSNDTKDALDSDYPSSENCFSSTIQGVGIIMAVEGPNDKAEVGDLDLSKASVTKGDSSKFVVAQDSVSLPLLKSAPKSSGDVPVTACVEDCRNSQDRTIHVDLSKAQIISAFGEVESGESKERFRQRLWCFLFENLNRAIDELYLLCELECDLEQMKEAILVLEEAASDFKELDARVEEFDNVKKSSSQPSIDGMPVTVRADHRRPHALSWEVSILPLSTY